MVELRQAPEPSEIAAVLAQYPGLAEASARPLESGLLHASFALRAGGREYVLQRVNARLAPAVHRNISLVTRFLTARGVETPRLIDTLAGELFADLGPAGRWRLMTRVPGVVFDACDSSEQARSAGALVAVFHSALADFEEDLQPSGFALHDTPQHLVELEDAVTRHSDHPLHADVVALAREVFRAARSWRELSGLPRRVIHGDLKFNNILFVGESPERRQQASCLIDLDTLSRMPLYFDLGDAWRSWCNTSGEDAAEAEFDSALFRASAEGYLAALTFDLTGDELASLAEGVERVSLELCARFAADALNESYFEWNRRDFESCGQHNLVRACGQLSLHRQLLETREERRRFLLG